jgi:uncharacterized protein YggT (Ycf19 family)
VDRREDPVEPGPEPVDRPYERGPYPAEPVESRASDTEVVSRFSPARRVFELVYLIFAVICVLLFLRIVLKLLAANTAVAFTAFIYALSGIFLAPFNGLLPTFVSGRTILEGSAIIAILVYALIGYLLARIMSIFFRRDVTVAHGSRGRYRTY